jgi:hypothetical protein
MSWAGAAQLLEKREKCGTPINEMIRYNRQHGGIF